MQRGVIFTDDCGNKIWVAVDKTARAELVLEGECKRSSELRLPGGHMVVVEGCFNTVLSKLGLITVDAADPGA